MQERVWDRVGLGGTRWDVCRPPMKARKPEGDCIVY